MQIKRGFTVSVAALVLAGAATVAAAASAPARTPPAATAPVAGAGPSAAIDPAFCGFDNRLTPPTIREGAAGNTVREAQCLLQLWGFYIGPGIDGAFGPLTTKATKAFQTSRGLTADGIIGPNTWTRLRNG
ncbi:MULTISPECIES: peptidoglycan-binding domain-containing protein [Streptomyces]|uniref:Serine/threonine protein kinase n=1 Tax=Streptomyces cadmiisoli TaxID=2184053 RepID=A0A2Z4J9E2_9ACTN|nr:MULTISPECIES: peptidoglycan-binding domain-containing protein [Streptomyces]AWW41669.1 serine/threonine protein kinase [Streptomyces cadmiisoli]